MVTVYDNFFSDYLFKPVYEQAKRTPLHSTEEHIKKYGIGSWPGSRSFELEEVDPLLVGTIWETLGRWHYFPMRLKGGWFVHLRPGSTKDEDWIHSDPNAYTVIIYLSPTNLSSGTKFYLDADEKNPDNDTMFVKFVQNRAVIFQAGIPHMSYNNHGTDINDGRLTINGFLYAC